MVFEQAFDCPGPNKICTVQSLPSTHRVTLGKIGYSSFGDSTVDDSIVSIDVDINRSAGGYHSDIDMHLVHENNCVGVNTPTALDNGGCGNGTPDPTMQDNAWCCDQPLPTDVSWLSSSHWSKFLPSRATEFTYYFNDKLLSSMDATDRSGEASFERGFINVGGLSLPAIVDINLYNYGYLSTLLFVFQYRCYEARCLVSVAPRQLVTFQAIFLEEPYYGVTGIPNGAEFELRFRGSGGFVTYRKIKECANICSWQGTDKNGNSYELKYDANSKRWSYKNVTKNITLATSESTEISNPVLLDAGDGLNMKGDNHGYTLKAGGCIFIPSPEEENNSPSAPAGQGSQPFIPDIRSPLHDGETT